MFDAVNHEEIASVKTHIIGQEENAIANYAKDLRATLGLVEDEQEKLDKAANSLWEARSDADKWKFLSANMPEAIRNASSQEELKEALKETASLRIPADHVEKVREYLDRVAQKEPELYGLPNDSSSEEFASALDDLKARVLPINEGLTAHEMRLAAKEIYQRKMAMQT